MEEEVSVPFLAVVSFPFHHLDVHSTVVGVVQLAGIGEVAVAGMVDHCKAQTAGVVEGV